jgi:nicotinate-nucleotide adenylyltransferase
LKKGTAVGLLGGSFNPAHGGHRHISLEMLRRLKLDAVWWLVSPQNPLKPAAGMAPLAARLASARAIARHPRIRVTDVEARLDVSLTVDTIAALRALYPQVRFVWIMGADNLCQFHRWTAWRDIARAVPVVVAARPGYSNAALAPAMGWLRRWRHRHPARWREWTLPAVVFVPLALDPRSATDIRRRQPDWALDAPMPAKVRA